MRSATPTLSRSAPLGQSRPLPNLVLIFLAVLPVADAVLNQVYSSGMIQPGQSLSALQAYKSVVYCILLWAMVSGSLSKRPVTRGAGTLLLFSGVTLLVFVFKEILDTDMLTSRSLLAYSKILYPVLLLCVAYMYCRSQQHARWILAGLAIGALVSAISVLYFSAIGANLTEEYQGVHATAGGFYSAKGLVGTIIVGAFLAVYLCPNKGRGVALLAALVCLAAAIATFNRSGFVAICAALTWLAIWYGLWGRKESANRWAMRLLVAGAVSGFVGIGYFGLEDLYTRWEDLASIETAGSGRLTIWMIVSNWWATADWPDKLLGIGYNRMMGIFYAVKDAEIHTHSDFFDMLAIGGLLGIAWLAAVYRAAWTCRRTLSRCSPEFALVTVVCLVFVVTSLATGQLMQSSVMASYFLAVASLGVLGRARHGTEGRTTARRRSQAR